MAAVEDPIHIAIYDYLTATLPHGWKVKHTPNKPRSMQQGVREKRMGAKKGWPDLEIFGPIDGVGRCWMLEVKPPGVTVPAYQRDLHDELRDAGFAVRVVRSVEDARFAVSAWRLPSRDMLIRDCEGASA